MRQPQNGAPRASSWSRQNARGDITPKPTGASFEACGVHDPRLEPWSPAKADGHQRFKKAAILLLLLPLFGPLSCSLFQREESKAPQDESPAPRTGQEEPSSSSTPTADYTIGPGDLMSVLVYGEPDLTSVVRVGNEGFIELPLVGQVRASGTTTPELKEEIEARMKEGYLINPDVHIILQEYKQEVVHLIGQVATPGPYRITHGNTLMGTISKAGGFTPIAKRNKVKIIRKENGGSKVFFVDMKAITKEGRLQDDVLLMPGDVIIVPERFF